MSNIRKWLTIKEKNGVRIITFTENGEQTVIAYTDGKYCYLCVEKIKQEYIKEILDKYLLFSFQDMKVKPLTYFTEKVNDEI